MPNFFIHYLARTRRYSVLRFIIEMALVPFPFKIAIGMLLMLFMGGPFKTTTDAASHNGLGVLLVLALLLAPLLETIIGQWLPIWLVGLFTKKFMPVLLISAFLFMLQHLHVGLIGALPIYPVGVALSWSFMRMRRISRWRAYGVTAFIHCLHNGLSLFVYYSMI